MKVSSDSLLTRESMPQRDGRQDFLDVLSVYPEVNPLPEPTLVQKGDTFETYVTRCVNAELKEEAISNGIYMINPAIGRLYLPDMTSGPGEFAKLLPEERVETRGLVSKNGFFAHNFTSPDGSKIRLAFRPFDPEINDCITEDFAKNMIVPQLGIGSVQTIGFYKGPGGRGGTISILDSGVRSIDQLNTDELRREDDDGSTILENTAKELAFIHAIGLAHGDVALRNIVRTDHNRIFMIDWGKAMPRRFSEENLSVIGTAQHDILSLYYDFINHWSAQDINKTGDKKPDQILNAQFFATYIKWRLEFNESKDVANRLPTAVLHEELSTIKNIIIKRIQPD